MEKSLPEAFINLRKPLLDQEWDSFISSYQEKPFYGLRRNPLKDCGVLPFVLEQIPWEPEGFYADPGEHPGRHPLHDAGAYYIQEPSAMSVVSLLTPSPGETICDLCAAPGGKSTQIAGRLQGQGLLVSNEIISDRAKILSQNIERMGIANTLVCNEAPDRMASFFPLSFDRILVDAPCSGEGMFRKDEASVDQWSPENISLCAKRQRMILNCADEMLKPGGTMVYSTCTFAPEENEEIIAWFLASHSDYVLEDWTETDLGQCVSSLPEHGGFSRGNPGYVRWDRLADLLSCHKPPAALEHDLSQALTGTLRLWPHRIKGEGHFAARLRKTGIPLPETGAALSDDGQNRYVLSAAEKNGKKKKKTDRKRKDNGYGQGSSPTEVINGYQDFENEFLLHPVLPPGSLPPRYELFGRELYLLPPQAPSLSGIKIVRAGLHLGSGLKNRFEPSYALAKALSREQVRQFHNCTCEEAVRYLKGETLSCDPAYRSWTLVCYHNCPLGWGKAQNGRLKNRFPRGLRWSG